MVLAGPGSGKTFVIVSRIKYLIEHEHIPPGQILVITFTRAAATQMRERFFALHRAENAGKVTFGTFHSVYFGILKRGRSLSADSIISGSEKRRMIAACLNVQLSDQVYSREEYDDLIDRICAEIERKQTADEFSAVRSQTVRRQESLIEQVAEAYKTEKKRRGKVDFSDMLTGCLDCLNSDPELCSMYRKRYRYILVDEFQDINPVQYRILKMIAAPENNLFVVGDDDQAIYGFRGSDPEIMLTFECDHPGCRKIVLNRNYRSTREIVCPAARLIRHNRRRYRKDLLLPDRTGELPEVIAFKSRSDQYSWIIQLLNGNAVTNDQDKSTAVLFRTNHGLLSVKKLMSADHQVIRELKAFVSAVKSIDKGSVARSDLLIITQRMNLPLTREMADRASDEHKTICWNRLLWQLKGHEWITGEISEFVRHLNRAGTMPPLASLRYLLEAAGLKQILLKDFDPEESEYAKTECRLSFALNAARGCSTWDEWELNMSAESQAKDHCTRAALLTIHSAKGLEFDTVIIPDVNRGMIPHPYGKTDEERRLFYVAMTRAKQRLILTTVINDRDRRGSMSGFIDESGLKPSIHPCV